MSKRRVQIVDKAPRAIRDASEMFEVDAESHPSWIDGTFQFKVHDNIMTNLHQNRVTRRAVKDSPEEQQSKAAAVAVLKRLLPLLEALLARQQAGNGAQADAEHPDNLVSPAARQNAREAADARVHATIAHSQKLFDERAAAEDADCDAMGIDRPRRNRWNPLIQRFTA